MITIGETVVEITHKANAAVIALVVVLLSVNALQASIVANGSFETFVSGADGGTGRQVFQVGTHDTNITGWTLEGSGDVYLHITPDIGGAIGANFNFAQAGNVYLNLSGGVSGDHATIYQIMPTIPGRTYELSFFIGAAFSPLSTINVTLDGLVPILNQTLTADAPSTNIDWKPESFTFIADSLSTKLSFRDVSSSDDNVSFVDNVSVNAVPEPPSLQLLAVGLIAFGPHRRKVRRVLA